MRYITLLAISLFSLTSVLSQNVIDRHFDYLLEQEDATNINVTGKMFEMINSINVEVDSEDSDDIAEMQEFLGSIRSFQLVSAKQGISARKQFNGGISKIEGDYEELLSVVDKEGSFILYIDEHNGTVHEVVGIGTDNKELMVFSLLGSMRLEHVGKVAEHIQGTGIDKLSKVKDYKVGNVKVYPNPINSTGNFTLETSEAFSGGVASLHDATGTVVKTYKVNSTLETYDVQNVAAGNYVLKVVKDEVSIKKKLIVVQ